MSASPLNLTKDIKILEDAIASLLETGTPKKFTTFWAKVEILKERLEMMRDGYGFTRGFSSVNDKEATEYIAYHEAS